MCGIAGIIEAKEAVSLAALEAMEASLLHRGPDSQGRHIDGNVALVHTRLSIIDLAGGQQPFFDDDKASCVIANAEIYNFLELRAEQTAQGHVFQTHSDCEVILPLHARHGRHCVESLRGMFAFAHWDRRRRKLLLGRDRMGEKPLYYTFSKDRLIFASELRTLLASKLVDRELNPRQIARYFRYQYVPEPDTPFKGIHKVPPGATLELDVESWTVDIQHYWRAWDAPPIEGDPKQIIREAVEDAVKTSLISDVPIGLSLSGGVDSSILACLMRAGTDKPINAISIGYPDAAQVDERAQARELSERLGIVFHDVEIDDQEMLSSFHHVVTSRDDPIGDIAGYNYFAIMRHARERGIKVMLQGHGLDELCWGYPWVRDAVALNEGRRREGPFFEGATLRQKMRSAVSQMRDFARPRPDGFQMFELQPYTAWVIKNARHLFAPAFYEEAGWQNLMAAREYGESGLRTDLEVTRLIVDYYLLENGIAQGDRLSMANSVEMRLPFVDYKLVETFVGLRKAQRDDHLPLKYWLKESVRDLLGDEILNRPKRGFAPPGVRWQKLLRTHLGAELRDGFLVEQRILSPVFAARLTASEISDPSESIVSRLAITLESWARGVILEEDLSRRPNASQVDAA